MIVGTSTYKYQKEGQLFLFPNISKNPDYFLTDLFNRYIGPGNVLAHRDRLELLIMEKEDYSIQSKSYRTRTETSDVV